MTDAWIQKRKKDQYYRLARLRGYRSRAAYKLLQTVRIYKLIKPGQKILDLGSQPGGWIQVARETVGPEGTVVGVDIKKTEPFAYANVKILNEDIYADDIVEKILVQLKGPADVVLSDLAPPIIGAWDVDHARQVDLARRALHIAENVLQHNGNVLIKLFHGPELKALEEQARPLFTRSRLLKPHASRPESSEIYFLGLGFKQKCSPPITTSNKDASSIILLTGQPGTGKTTIVRKTLEQFANRGVRIAGIISDEVRENGLRIGFKITNVSTGEHGWLAKKNDQTTKRLRIGAYTVEEEDLEKIGAEALVSATSSKPDLIVIDEIGPMEMTNRHFRENLANILSGTTPVLATVRQGSRYPEVEKVRQKALWFDITKDNRELVQEKLIRYMEPLLLSSPKKTRTEQ
jgi:23S rRNA (uridine2552-2'-O)-methyltransferase